jgi:Cu/Ag efflux pump CusA
MLIVGITLVVVAFAVIFFLYSWFSHGPLGKTLLGTLMGASVLALTMASASAAIVCSGNTCWHVKESHQYRQMLV